MATWSVMATLIVRGVQVQKVVVLSFRVVLSSSSAASTSSSMLTSAPEGVSTTLKSTSTFNFKSSSTPTSTINITLQHGKPTHCRQLHTAYHHQSATLSPSRKLWMFKTKRLPSGVIKKCKVRLTVRGDVQAEGVDYNEVWSPVRSGTTGRLMFTLQMVLGFVFTSDGYPRFDIAYAVSCVVRCIFCLVDMAKSLGRNTIKTSLNPTNHEDDAAAMILGNTLVPPDYSPRRKFLHLFRQHHH